MAQTAAPKPTLTTNYTSWNTTTENDIALMQKSQDMVTLLEKQLKEACKKNDKSAEITLKRELTKAKADLKRDKAYFVADKKELKRLHTLAINERKMELKKNQKLLSKAENQLGRDVHKLNTEAIERDAQVVAQHQRAVKKSEQ